MAELENKTIAIIATNDFEDSELTSPLEAVQKAGATVKVLAPKAGTITGKNGTEINVDATTKDSEGETFDGIILPGGTNNADPLPPGGGGASAAAPDTDAGGDGPRCVN